MRHADIATSTRRLGAALAMVALAGCGQPGSVSPSVQEPPLSAPTTAVQAQPLGGTVATATQLGSGPVKVALILPLTAANGPSVVGASLRNAADLALSESGANDLTILVKDDRSTPDGARDATTAALGEGAELVLGPLFANDVRETARVAKAAGKPVIGFSTDTAAASRGVYLLSFLVESYVDRIVDFAASRGKKSFAALVPDSDYGRVAEAEFSQAAARRNVRVQAIEHFAPGGAAAAVGRIAALGDQIDALFIPEQADGLPAIATALAANGLDGKRVQLLGTGVWNDARILKLPALQGAWFAAPENAGFNAFAQRYRAKFGTDPTRIATLAYDAVSLTAALARTQGPQRFSEGILTAGSGFNGADGVFRFRADGPNERGLAVLQISGGGATTLSAAPRSFAGVPSGT